MDDVPEFQKKKIGELKKEVAFLGKISLSSAIQYIVSDLEYMHYLREYAEKFGGSVEDYEGVLEELKNSAAPFKTIREFLLHVEEVKEKIIESKNDKNENRVSLATIHRVKGMEFKNVIIINCMEGNIPYCTDDEGDIEEERRIAYVGLTRAKDKAVLISPRRKEGKVKEESRFIKEGKIIEEIKDLDVKIGERLNIKGVGQGEIIEIKGETIKVKFTNCEVRSYSYKVLKENGLIFKV